MRRARQSIAVTIAPVIGTVVTTAVTFAGWIAFDDTLDTIEWVVVLVVSLRCGVRPGAISALGDWSTENAVLSPLSCGRGGT